MACVVFTEVERDLVVVCVVEFVAVVVPVPLKFTVKLSLRIAGSNGLYVLKLVLVENVR